MTFGGDDDDRGGSPHGAQTKNGIGMAHPDLCISLMMCSTCGLVIATRAVCFRHRLCSLTTLLLWAVSEGDGEDDGGGDDGGDGEGEERKMFIYIFLKTKVVFFCVLCQRSPAQLQSSSLKIVTSLHLSTQDTK